ncbi:MAG: hypothetical protein CME38_09590 [Haliea sp.]|nr:hypothetical protein [Haliea sp.]|tara:strand:+ start:4856 stop:5272 length:417 start_codon:yes stop_codon:yes gene_type:complete
MNEPRSKDSPGRGVAVIVYGLYLGAIMTLVTLPLGALLAALGLRRSAGWVATHLRFQLWTFLGLTVSGIAALLLWQLLGQMAAPPMSAWAFGYLYFTLAIGWMIGRCGVGIHRLTANRPIERPDSLLFGGVSPALSDG